MIHKKTQVKVYDRFCFFTNLINYILLLYSKSGTVVLFCYNHFMFNGDSYKLSFVFALTIHVVLMFFLAFKSNYSPPVASFVSTNGFISATTINQKDFERLFTKKTVVAEKKVIKQKKPITKKQQKVIPKKAPKKVAIKNEKMKGLLHKKMLDAQKEELADLKKKSDLYKKEQAKKREEEMQKSLDNDLLEEKNRIKALEEEVYSRRAQGEVDRHKALIIQAISSEWIMPHSVDGDLVCKLLINVSPGGAVIDVKLVKSSGNEALDRSAQTAVLKSSPLPVPEDIKLFDRMRTIVLTFKPEGIVGS